MLKDVYRSTVYKDKKINTTSISVNRVKYIMKYTKKEATIAS